MVVQLYPMHPPGGYGPGAWVQNNFGRVLLLPSREENINSLGAAVQHNSRRTLLLPSRDDNINSLGAAVQYGSVPVAPTC